MGLISLNQCLVDAIIKTAESLDWTVTQDNGEFEFQKYSPAGQDFNMSISAESLSELNNGLYERYNNFDCSEEAHIWLDESGHGKNGAPYDMKDLYEDMEACEEMIRELAEKIQEIEYEDTIEDNQFEIDDDYEDEEDLEQ